MSYSTSVVTGGTWDYLKENKDYPYYLLRDWLGAAEGTSLKQLRKGQGKILNLAGKKVAAFRDQKGKCLASVARVHSPEMYCRLEQCGKNLGLSVPRVAIQSYGRGAHRSC